MMILKVLTFKNLLVVRPSKISLHGPTKELELKLAQLPIHLIRLTLAAVNSGSNLLEPSNLEVLMLNL